jgi:hypothetical protein
MHVWLHYCDTAAAVYVLYIIMVPINRLLYLYHALTTSFLIHPGMYREGILDHWGTVDLRRCCETAAMSKI